MATNDTGITACMTSIGRFATWLWCVNSAIDSRDW